MQEGEGLNAGGEGMNAGGEGAECRERMQEGRG